MLTKRSFIVKVLNSKISLTSYISPNVMLFCWTKGLWELWKLWLPFPFFKMPFGMSDFLSPEEILIVTRFDFPSADLKLFKFSVDFAKLRFKVLLTEMVTEPLLWGLIDGPLSRFSWKQHYNHIQFTLWRKEWQRQT